jgi:hypothetical protein
MKMQQCNNESLSGDRNPDRNEKGRLQFGLRGEAIRGILRDWCAQVVPD